MNISFIPWESHFPESHGPLSTSNLFVSGLASHFSDHRSACFPDACSWKAPRRLPNQCTQHELSSIPQLLSCFCQPSHRRPPHLPNGQSQKPRHHPKCLPHHTLNPNSPQDQGVSASMSFKSVCLSPPPGRRHLPPLWSLYVVTLSFPNSAFYSGTFTVSCSYQM